MLKYRNDLKLNSKKLRNKSTLSEILLWNKLKGRQINNYQFLKQKPIGAFIVDFFCPAKELIIEIDGISHMNKYDYDQKRINYFKSIGLKVIVFTDLEVKRSIQYVVQTIANATEE
ncbi:MAG: endonuclease domain-containing protein [Candidatus Dojkabacteria bacterium]